MRYTYDIVTGIIKPWCIGLCLLFVPAMLAAQEADPAGEAPDEPQAQTEIVINEEYEDRLSRLFSNYFDPATYFINVRTLVTQERIAVAPPAAAEVAPARAVRLPGLPVTLRDAESERQIQQSFQSFVTGLRGPEQRDVIMLTEIIIFADNMYGAADVAFMENLSMSAIPFYPDRGDQITVIQQAFPQRIITTEPLRIELSEPLAPPPQIQVLVPEQIAHRVSAVPVHVWIGIGLILLLAAVVIIVWLYTRRAPAAVAAAGAASSSNRFNITQEGGSGGERGFVMPDRLLEPEPRPEPDHRTYLMSLFMDRPIEVASLLERWIKLDEQKGSLKAAQLINNVDARFMLLIEKYMSKDAYESLLEASEDPASREKYETLEDFREITKEVRQSLRDGTATGLKEYEFIQFIENDQLLQIAQEISDNDLALMIRNLPPKRSAWLLEMIGTERTRIILSLITRMETINYETLRDSAGKLFEKYFSMQSAHTYTNKDIERIISTIEETPISKQEQYLAMLAETEPSLFNIVNKRIITWDRLTMVDEAILKEAFDDIDSRTMALALKDTPAYLEDELLTLRPQREQLMISEMMQEAEPSSKETENARRLILDAVKEARELLEKAAQ
ncbi:MAG: FliG C-terminal domain-containing protein [Bacteroidales bacterium]|nr:FliG C-terminal domain-containing protein [Bacteroidales bacterium]